MKHLARYSLPLLLLLGAACFASGAAASRMLVDDGQGASARPAGAGADYALQVEDYSAGQCTFVTLIRGAERHRIVDSCHGWSSHGCHGAVALVSQGVTADQGALVLAPDGRDNLRSRQLDLGALVLAEIRRARGARYEYLHLDFGSARCTGEGLDIAFTGSTIAQDASGSARAMEGRIVVTAGAATLRFSAI